MNDEDDEDEDDTELPLDPPELPPEYDGDELCVIEALLARPGDEYCTLLPELPEETRELFEYDELLLPVLLLLYAGFELILGVL